MPADPKIKRRVIVGVVGDSVGGAKLMWTIPPAQALVLLARLMPVLAQEAARERSGGEADVGALGHPPLVGIDGGKQDGDA